MGNLRMSGLAEWLAALNSPSLQTRLEGDAALVAQGTVAEAPLIALLRDTDAPDEARWRAAFTLGTIGSPAAMPTLTAGLRDASWSVRHACACALGEMADPAAALALWAVVTAPVPDEQVNYVAAIGLLRVNRSQGEAMLRAAAAGSSRAGRNTAISALASLAY
ncbi:MAG TPA: HEAT repeat domain-containing protein [Candidatus Limnocylindrales bacterium]|nr:HEAT repeat domain-containing protein [Candidatus Limnocylindrales bacterium]